ncbi:hypothetical protein C900_02197 [Fulvivirga imtechensis AK7]|uniref:Uncharacterized protein n=1 Tax=Fulvivirga imtechensis AK7 TaxID=1237149 RepID=L8JX81_9BACT|nr:hypothetical protein C900_02197 [Fulvivirga imtechensis AK7]
MATARAPKTPAIINVFFAPVISNNSKNQTSNLLVGNWQKQQAKFKDHYD